MMWLITEWNEGRDISGIISFVMKHPEIEMAIRIDKDKQGIDTNTISFATDKQHFQLLLDALDRYGFNKPFTLEPLNFKFF